MSVFLDSYAVFDKGYILNKFFLLPNQINCNLKVNMLSNLSILMSVHVKSKMN